MVCRGCRSITIASGFQESVPDHTPRQGPRGNDPSQCDTTGNRYQALKVNVLLENYLSPDGWKACQQMRQATDSSSSPTQKIYTHPDINKCVSFKVRGVFVNTFLSEASFVIPIVYSDFVIKSIL